MDFGPQHSGHGTASVMYLGIVYVASLEGFQEPCSGVSWVCEAVERGIWTSAMQLHGMVVARVELVSSPDKAMLILDQHKRPHWLR